LPHKLRDRLDFAPPERRRIFWSYRSINISSLRDEGTWKTLPGKQEVDRLLRRLRRTEGRKQVVPYYSSLCFNRCNLRSLRIRFALGAHCAASAVSRKRPERTYSLHHETLSILSVVIGRDSVSCCAFVGRFP